jgi:hypothetical protein
MAHLRLSEDNSTLGRHAKAHLPKQTPIAEVPAP